MKMETKKALIIFSRLPVPGRVKTRLASAIGDERAFELFSEMFRRCLLEGARIKAGRFLYLTPFPKDIEAFLKDWPETSRYSLRKQSGQGLGARMEDAFLNTFSLGFKRAVLVGTDIPGLLVEHINKALFMLGETDVVIGPTEDGGYYLIVLNHTFDSYQDIFHHIPWGQDRVLEITIERLKKRQKRFYLLDHLRDIDDGSDLSEGVFDL